MMKKDSLRKTFVIFICTFDPFQDRRHIYSFENMCRENTSIILGDETVKIFLNTRGNIDDVDADMKEFLTYVENTTDTFAAQTNSNLVKEIHRKVIEVKQSKEMEVEYMTLLQRDRENIELGRQEGRQEGGKLGAKIIRAHLKGMSNQEIAAALQIESEYVNSVISDFETI